MVKLKGLYAPIISAMSATPSEVFNSSSLCSGSALLERFCQTLAASPSLFGLAFIPKLSFTVLLANHFHIMSSYGLSGVHQVAPHEDSGLSSNPVFDLKWTFAGGGVNCSCNLCRTLLLWVWLGLDFKFGSENVNRTRKRGDMNPVTSPDSLSLLAILVAEAGFEPATYPLSRGRSTN